MQSAKSVWVSVVTMAEEILGLKILGKIQPGQNLLDLVPLGGTTRKFLPIARPATTPRALGAHPMVGSGDHPLPGQQGPEGFHLDPIGNFPLGKETTLGIQEDVVDQPVLFRGDSRDQGDVIREGIAGNRGNQAFRPDAPACKCNQAGQSFFAQICWPSSIQ